MRGLDESSDVLARTGQKAQEQVRHVWDGFVNFAARDNVLEVALGLMYTIVVNISRANC
jgi:large conductance mechanosensitive channel